MSDTNETQAADKEQGKVGFAHAEIETETETLKRLEELQRRQTELQQQLLESQAQGIMTPTRGKMDKVSPAKERLQTAASAAAQKPNRTNLMHYMKLKRNGFQN